MERPRILLTGHACIDYNISEQAQYTSWGSGVLYMSKYYQDHRQLRPIILTQYGPDLLPYSTEFQLQPATPPYDKTLIYENTMRNGRRTQRCLNLEQAQPLPLRSSDTQRLRTTDILIVAPLLPNYSYSYLQNMIAWVPNACLKVLCPQGYFRTVGGDGEVQSRPFSEALAILSLFDLVVFSDEDTRAALSMAQQWKRKLQETDIIITQANQGASIVHADSVHHIPTQPIANEDIVDSVGCGDVFAAAVAYHMYETRDLVAAIHEGHRAAHDKLLSVNLTAS